MLDITAGIYYCIDDIRSENSKEEEEKEMIRLIGNIIFVLVVLPLFSIVFVVLLLMAVATLLWDSAREFWISKVEPHL